MKLEGIKITLNSSTLIELELTDSIRDCLIEIQKSELGVGHPIRTKSGARFQCNHVYSEIPSPILLYGTFLEGDFSGVRDNYFYYKNTLDGKDGNFKEVKVE